MKWLCRSIPDPRLVKTTTDVAFLVIDLYAEHMGHSPEIDHLIERLHDSVRKEAEISQICWSTLGMTEMLAAG